MHIRIYWGKIQPDAWPSIERKYRELMEIPAKGLLGRFVTQDVNDPDSMFTITMWQDLASIETWEASPEYREVFLEAVSPFIIGSQSVSLCEVKVAKATDLLGALAGKR
jgi:heme-degrading monooxygenase HmoA